MTPPDAGVVGEEPGRGYARELARQALARGEPRAWFERLYAHSARTDAIPWADLRPNPFLVEWLDTHGAPDGRCLVVGCGLGDDAQVLAALGLEVTAFDIAPSAVAWCRRRFPASTVRFSVADVLGLPGAWLAAFDFVLSAYTLQVLPPSLRRGAAAGIASALTPGGTALVLARGRGEPDPSGEMPWPLTPGELTSYFGSDLEIVELADFIDSEEPPVRRLRATLRRPGRHRR